MKINVLLVVCIVAVVVVIFVVLMNNKSKITLGRSEKIILLGFDGLGSHNLKTVNNLTNFQYLFDNGMWTLDAQTDDVVLSGPNWVGILSGCTSRKSKVTNNQCIIPRCKTLLTDNSAVYTEWDIIKCYSENIGLYKYNSRPNMTTIMSVIDSNYKFVFLHLDELDAAGHSYTASHIFYKNKLKQLDDEVLGPIIEYVDSNNATLIITSDHAFDLHGYGHSGLPVPVILYGKGVDKGRIKGNTKNRDVFKYVNQLGYKII